MPNGTLDSLNCILDPNEDLTVIFHGAALVFLRQSRHNLATLLDLSIPCGNQFLNVLVFFSHDGTSLLSLLLRPRRLRRYSSSSITLSTNIKCSAVDIPLCRGISLTTRVRHSLRHT